MTINLSATRACPRCLKGKLITDSEAFTGVSCLACGHEPKPEGWTAPEWEPEESFRNFKPVNLEDYELF